MTPIASDDDVAASGVDFAAYDNYFAASDEDLAASHAIWSQFCRNHDFSPALCNRSCCHSAFLLRYEADAITHMKPVMLSFCLGAVAF